MKQTFDSIKKQLSQISFKQDEVGVVEEFLNDISITDTTPRISSKTDIPVSALDFLKFCIMEDIPDMPLPLAKDLAVAIYMSDSDPENQPNTLDGIMKLLSMFSELSSIMSKVRVCVLQSDDEEEQEPSFPMKVPEDIQIIKTSEGNIGLRTNVGAVSVINAADEIKIITTLEQPEYIDNCVLNPAEGCLQTGHIYALIPDKQYLYFKRQKNYAIYLRDNIFLAVNRKGYQYPLKLEKLHELDISIYEVSAN